MAHLQISITNFVSLANSINSSDIDYFFENRIQRVPVPTYSNYVELLVNLLNKQFDANTVNNVYYFAMLFPILEIKKDRMGKHAFEFKSNLSNDSIYEKRIPKQFDKNKIIRFLESEFKITRKTDKEVIEIINKGATEFKKVINELCFIIVLSCIQDSKKMSRLIKELKSNFYSF